MKEGKRKDRKFIAEKSEVNRREPERKEEKVEENNTCNISSDKKKKSNIFKIKMIQNKSRNKIISSTRLCISPLNQSKVLKRIVIEKAF